MNHPKNDFWLISTSFARPAALLAFVLAVEAFLASVELSESNLLVVVATAVGQVFPVVKSHMATETPTGILGVFLAVTILILPLKVWGAYRVVRTAGGKDMALAIGSSSTVRQVVNVFFLTLLCAGGTYYVFWGFADHGYFQSSAPGSAAFKNTLLTAGGLKTWLSWSILTEGVIAFAWAFMIFVLVRAIRTVKST